MDSIGIDVAKCQSQVAILCEDGELIERRIPTRTTHLTTLLGARPRARILLEACTESEWVARCLEALGHEVIVADPNYAPMYGMRQRRIKTDRRDALALAEACRLGAYRPVHRVSEAQHLVRAQLTTREVLVRTRSRCICVIRALLRQEGLRVPTGNADTFGLRVAAVAVPKPLTLVLRPLLATLRALNDQIDTAADHLEDLTRTDPRVRLLCTLPGVGPITAAAFVAALDTAGRFQGPHQVQAYLGLVPREYSSGERRQRGRLTKGGNGRGRWLLVEAAWRILRLRRPETRVLWTWAAAIAARRGRKTAAVALARRLAGILYAMLRDQKPFDPRRFAAATEAAA